MTLDELRKLDELLGKYHNTIARQDYPEQSYQTTRADVIEQVAGSLWSVKSAKSQESLEKADDF